MVKELLRLKKTVVIVTLLAGAAACLGLLIYQPGIFEKISDLVDFLSDRNNISTYISAYGPWAPLIFMAFQVLQVVFAPVPGEVTGFAGGYLFGVWRGFVYSSIALTMGSIINFAIGSFLGRRFIRRLIPPEHLQRFDTLVRHEGALIIFILFVFPGFPKDYLCLFLGLSTIPFKIFVWLAAVGRMPGTFMLSLQGSILYREKYTLLIIVACVFCLFVLLSYYFRETLYRWIEKQNRRNGNG
jgi:uncharacterized membrane protein YdjX (TVP38/TMEM64 family)